MKSDERALTGVIFDVGGTMVNVGDYERANAEFVAGWAAERRLRGGDDAVEAVLAARQWMWAETKRSGRQITAADALCRAAEQLGWPTDAKFIEEATAQFFTPENRAIELYPEAHGAIMEVVNLGVPMGILSDASDQDFIDDLLMRVGLSSFFDPVVTSAACGPLKPAPDGFREVLDTWGIEPEGCVMIGDDHDRDIAGAKALGMRAIWIDRVGAAAENGDCDADVVVPDLGAAVEVIEGWL